MPRQGLPTGGAGGEGEGERRYGGKRAQHGDLAWFGRRRLHTHGRDGGSITAAIAPAPRGQSVVTSTVVNSGSAVMSASVKRIARQPSSEKMAVWSAKCGEAGSPDCE